MNAESVDASTSPLDEADYAALARDVRYLKAAMVTIAQQIASQAPASPQDDSERAILTYLTGTVPPADRVAARAALGSLTILVHEVATENGLTEDQLADRFDAARRAAPPSQ